MNLNLNFKDCSSKPFANKKVLFTPTATPTISASYLTVADSIQLYTDNLGNVTSSFVSGIYKVDIATPLPATSFYVNVNENTTTLISSSVVSGSAKNVEFDLIDIIKDPFDVKKVTVTPTINYPTYFSGSVYTLNSTGSITNNTGSTTYTNLIPGIYQVDCFGKITTTFFVSVPATGATNWLAKDLLIVKPKKGTSVKLHNLDNSYVLTVSSSDARYASKYGVNYNNQSSSYSDNSISASYAKSASYASNVPASGISGSLVNGNMPTTISVDVLMANQIYGPLLGHALTCTQAVQSIYSDTASYVDISNVVGTITTALTSSYPWKVVGGNIIDQGGNVGININSPLTPLHIISTGSANQVVDVITLQGNQTFANSRNAGVGIRFSQNNDGTKADLKFECSNDTNGSRVRFLTQASQAGGLRDVVCIDENGRVGIGTTASLNTLDVVGNVSASAFIGSFTGTASYSNQSKSASYASTSFISNTASYVASVVSSSYSKSSSWAPVDINYSASVSTQLGTKQATLVTGNTYSITSSVAVKSISASYAPTDINYSSSVSTLINAKASPIVNGQTYSITSSVAINSISSSYAPFVVGLSTSASYASSSFSSISASYAPTNVAYSASVVTQLNGKQNTLVTASTLPVTASVAIKSVSASYAPYVVGIATSATFASSSNSASYSLFADHSTTANLADTATSAAYASNCVGNSATATSSSFASTASYVVRALNSNTASLSNTASMAKTVNFNGGLTSVANVTFASVIANTMTAGTFTGNLAGDADYAYVAGTTTNADSASYVKNSVSASFATNALNAVSCIDSANAEVAGFADSATSSSYSKSSSFSRVALSASYAPGNPAISSSYATTASYSNNSGFANIAGVANGLSFTVTTASYAKTASWAINSVNTVNYSSFASYAISSSMTDTASYVKNAVSASWAPPQVVPPSTTAISASWASSSLSASYAPAVMDTVFSASVASGKQNTLIQNNLYVISSSYGVKSLSASYAPIDNTFSSSLVNQIGSKQSTLSGTNNYVPLWNNNNLTATSSIYQSGSNIGINSTNPIEKLTIVVPDNSYGLRIGSAGTTENSFNGIRFGYDANVNTNDYFIGKIEAFKRPGGGGDLILNAANSSIAYNTNQLFIGKNGNVGIGTASVDNKLQVLGNILCNTITASLNGTASYSSNADMLEGQHGAYYLTASNFAGNYSASVSTQIGTKQPTLTNSLYAITASTITNVNIGGTNTLIGFEVGKIAYKSDLLNTGVGYQVLRSLVSGSGNTAFGIFSQYYNNSGNYNNSIGLESLQNATNSSGQNAIGVHSLFNSNGSNNNALGFYAGSGGGGNESSYIDTQCNFIGYQSSRHSSVPSGSVLTNATAIGANSKVGQSNTIALGSVGTKVGISVIAPVNMLDVAGNISASYVTASILTPNIVGVNSTLPIKVSTGNGIIIEDADIIPSKSTFDIGTTANKFQNGYFSGTVFGTSSVALSASTANYANSANNSNTAATANSAAYSTTCVGTSSYASNSDTLDNQHLSYFQPTLTNQLYNITASAASSVTFNSLRTTDTAMFQAVTCNTVTATTFAGNLNGNALTATNATNAATASYILTASYSKSASYSTYAGSSISAGDAATAEWAATADSATSSSYARTASYALNGGGAATVSGTTNYVPKYNAAGNGLTATSSIFDTNLAVTINKPLTVDYINSNASALLVNYSNGHTVEYFGNSNNSYMTVNGILLLGNGVNDITQATVRTLGVIAGSSQGSNSLFDVVNSAATQHYLHVGSTGKVGVNTTASINQLEVNGNISCNNITGSLNGNANNGCKAWFTYNSAVSGAFTQTAGTGITATKTVAGTINCKFATPLPNAYYAIHGEAMAGTYPCILGFTNKATTGFTASIWATANLAAVEDTTIGSITVNQY